MPVSYIDIVLFPTFSATLNSSCDKPLSFLNCLIFSAKPTGYPLFTKCDYIISRNVIFVNRNTVHFLFCVKCSQKEDFLENSLDKLFNL